MCTSGISQVYIRHITGTIYKISDKSQAYLKYMLGISQSLLKYILGPAFFTLSQHILNTFKSQSQSPYSHVNSCLFVVCLPLHTTHLDFWLANNVYETKLFLFCSHYCNVTTGQGHPFIMYHTIHAALLPSL